MSAKDKFDEYIEDAWKIDNFIEEYNWEQRRKHRQKPLCKEIKKQNQNPRRHKFMEEHTAVALCILAGIGALSFWCPFFWIAFFIYLFSI